MEILKIDSWQMLSRKRKAAKESSIVNRGSVKMRVRASPSGR
jgi:hypothetical protein